MPWFLSPLKYNASGELSQPTRQNLVAFVLTIPSEMSRYYTLFLSLILPTSSSFLIWIAAFTLPPFTIRVAICTLITFDLTYVQCIYHQYLWFDLWCSTFIKVSHQSDSTFSLNAKRSVWRAKFVLTGLLYGSFSAAALNWYLRRKDVHLVKDYIVLCF